MGRLGNPGRSMQRHGMAGGLLPLFVRTSVLACRGAIVVAQKSMSSSTACAAAAPQSRAGPATDPLAASATVTHGRRAIRRSWGPA